MAKIATFTLTGTEAAYVVAALRIALDHLPESGDGSLCHNREVMTGIMDRLAAPMKLDADVIERLERKGGL